MDQIFLHIGYPKTGTSAIQTTLHASRAALSEAGIVFPDVHAGLCNVIAAYFYERPQSLFPYCDMASDADEIQRCIEHGFYRIALDLKQSACSVAVISTESLIALNYASVCRLRDWVLSIAKKATVVCYVRRPTSYAASVIQERVKWGERLPLPASDLPIPRFEHQLPNWEAAFGRENMVVRSASRDELIGHDVVMDFTKLIGFHGELDRSIEYNNESLSHVAVLLLDALSAIDNRLVASNLGFQELWKLPGEKYRLSHSLMRSVELQSKPHLRYLRDRWGIEFQDEVIETGEGNVFSKATAQGLADFIAEIHKQARTGEPSPFRERW